MVFSRTLALPDGSELYVEPVTVAAAGENVLVAGWPSYLHTWDAPGRPRRLPADGILGAVIDSTGGARAVPSPISARLVSQVRALGRADGTWDVVIPELIPHTAEMLPRTDTVARIWHGVFDGEEWRSWEEIPIPQGIALTSEGVSPLVAAGDTLAVAFRSGPSFRRSVVIFQRTAAGWSSETLDTGWTGKLALAHSPGSGLLLAAPRADESGQGGSMALSLYARTGGWKPPRLVDSGEHPVHSPVLAVFGGTVILAWTEDADGGSTVRATEDPLHAPLDSSRLMDPRHGSLRGPRLLATPTTVHWFLSPDVPGAPTQLFTGTVGEIRAVGEVPNPFLLGVFGFAAVGDTDLLLTGATLKDDTPLSLILRTRPRCAARARQEASVSDRSL